MESSYSIFHKGSEYRILLSPVRLDVLSDKISSVVLEKNIDVSEFLEMIPLNRRCCMI